MSLSLLPSSSASAAAAAAARGILNFYRMNSLLPSATTYTGMAIMAGRFAAGGVGPRAAFSSTPLPVRAAKMALPTMPSTGSVFGRRMLLPMTNSSPKSFQFEPLVTAGGTQQAVRTFASRRFHKKKIIRMAKGYRGRTNCYRIAIRRVEKALQYAYRDRKVRKREFRKLWIQRLNAGVRQHGLSYSTFIHMLHGSGTKLNRRMLADLAGMEPFSFKAVVDVVKSRAAAQAKVAA